ncbi:M16 family metallopeptidase [Robertkochia flava]|uniref:M16 family metallopeptidase n=1 Tax=Robertkochia flava TaxID=3447986 RepID=UPI001CCE7088|nr:M16 family metallopeptidase [Robertkochia marina]
MKNILRVFCIGILGISAIHGQESKSVPMDKAVVTGQLENGIKYYIRHNEEPKDRASFYFAQNVGSVLEKDSQRGLAHFLEHMAFNGLEHFEGKAMLEYLEKNGIRFGSEINAFTAFDETVYNVSSVPVGREQLLDSVLLVLKDWSNGLTLNGKDIDEERGVINEEWRTRNTPGLRAAFKIWEEGTLKGSKYAERFPIGLMEVVNNFEYDELRDYYKTWYRPDQQAVVVVGDIDVEAMEKKIRALFSTIPLRKGLPERGSFEVPLPGEFNYVEVVDPELGSASLQFIAKRKADDYEGTEKLDMDMVQSVVSSVYGSRMSEFLTNVEAPALSVRFGYSNFVRPTEVFTLSVTPREGRMVEAMEFALMEMKRLAQHGATEGELERTITAMKTGIINREKNKHKISNDQHAKQLYNHYFNGGPLADISWYKDYALARLETISNEDIKAWINDHFDLSNTVIAVTGNGKEEYPSKAAFEGVLEKVKTLETSPYKDTYVDKPLVEDELKDVAIVATEQIEALDARIYTLENGVRFVLYPTDHSKDQIMMKAYSPGGMSLLNKEALPAAQLATYVSSQSGLGSFDLNDLRKKLKGKRANASVGLQGNAESLNGSSNREDLEVLFQQVYLFFEAPRFEEDALSLTKDFIRKNLKSREGDKQAIFRDSLQLASANYHERVFFFDEELVENIDLATIKEVYADRFSNISDFTFFFVGDFDEARLKEYARRYLGSIKGQGKEETYIDHDMEPAKGKTLVHLKEELETPQTSVNISLTHEMPYNYRNTIKNGMLAELLKKRYNEVIREQEGGSYGVGVGSNVSRIPDERFGLSVNFNCNPEMRDKLVAVVYDEMQKIQGHIELNDLVEVKKNMQKSRAEQYTKNSYWMSALLGHVLYGNEVIDQEDFNTLIDDISAKELMEFATYINSADVVEGILDPIVSETAE